MEFKINTERLILCLQTVIILSTACLLCFILWACFRGIDLTDEGSYLLFTNYPSDVMATTSFSGVYLHPIFKLLNYNIAYLRIFGVIFSIFSIFVFFYGFKQLLMRFFNSKQWLNAITLLCVVFIINSLQYLYPLTPSYNTLNNWLIFMASGLFFLIYCNKVSYFKYNILYIIATLLGFILGMDFFIKATSSVSVMFTICFLLIFFSSHTLRSKIYIFVSIVLGIILHLVFYFAVLQNYRTWLYYFINGMAILRDIPMGHNALQIYMHLKQIILLFNATVGAFMLPIMIICTVIVLQIVLNSRKIITKKYLHKILISIFIMTCVVFCLKLNIIVMNILDVIVILLGWIIVFCGMLLIKQFLVRANVNYSDLLIMLFLFVLPFEIACGTNNIISQQITISIIPWFFLIFVLFLITMENNKFLFWLFITFLTLFALSEIVLKMLYSPYSLPYRGHNFTLEQQIPTKINHSMMYLDKSTHGFIIKLEQMAKQCGFKSGDYILAFYDMPGIVYALGGRSPVCPWFFSGYNVDVNFADKCLSIYKKNHVLKNAFLLLNYASRSSKTDYTLPNSINLKQNYTSCGIVRSAWENIEMFHVK